MAFYRDISGIQTFTLRKERQFLGCQISPCVSGIWEMENHDESMCICSLITLEWKLMNISVQNALCCVLIYSIVSDSLRSHGLQPARLFCPWGFSRQEYWSGLPYPPPEDLPNPGIEPRSPPLQMDSLPSEYTEIKEIHGKHWRNASSKSH